MAVKVITNTDLDPKNLEAIPRWMSCSYGRVVESALDIGDSHLKCFQRIPLCYGYKTAYMKAGSYNSESGAFPYVTIWAARAEAGEWIRFVDGKPTVADVPVMCVCYDRWDPDNNLTDEQIPDAFKQGNPVYIHSRYSTMGKVTKIRDVKAFSERLQQSGDIASDLTYYTPVSFAASDASNPGGAFSNRALNFTISSYGVEMKDDSNTLVGTIPLVLGQYLTVGSDQLMLYPMSINDAAGAGSSGTDIDAIVTAAVLIEANTRQAADEALGRRIDGLSSTDTPLPY